MKKTFQRFSHPFTIAILALVALCTSCTNEEGQDPENDDSQGKAIELTKVDKSCATASTTIPLEKGGQSIIIVLS